MDAWTVARLNERMRQNQAQRSTEANVDTSRWTPEQTALAGVFDIADYAWYFPTVGTGYSTCDHCGVLVINTHLQRHAQDHAAHG